MGLPSINLEVLDVPLTEAKPHNLKKSDLETTLNIGMLTSEQKLAIMYPLPELQAVSVLKAFVSHGLAGVKPLFEHSTTSLRRYFEMEARVASLNKNGGKHLIEDFFSNTIPKREITYYPGSAVSDLVANNDRFKNIARAFEKDFVGRYQFLLNRKQASFDIADLGMELNRHGLFMTPPATPFFGLGDPLAILGSFQQIDVRLVGWNQGHGGDYEATLRYELYDHFGCDDSDLTGLPSHGTPGQIAMWLLARKPEHGPGNKPFVVKIEVDRVVAGAARF